MTQRFSCRIIIKGEVRTYARPQPKRDTDHIEQLVREYTGEVVKVPARHARGLSWKLKAQALRPWERKPEQRKRGPYKSRKAQ